jgi:hypothetical protein
MKKKWDELVVNVILLALGAVALFLLIQIIYNLWYGVWT